MKIGFLILAHHLPNQLKKLIESLLVIQNSKIYIHIDLKNNKLFSEVKYYFKDNTRVNFITEQYKVSWGNYNQIRATYALIKCAVKSNTENYFMLISGQDFLIKKPNELIHFFLNNNGKEFLVNFKLPDAQWADGGLNRLGCFNFNFLKVNKILNKVNSLITIIQFKLNIFRKPYFQQYGGSNWFNLSYQCLNYIHNYIQKNPKYLSTFKYTLTAEEIFIQSIVMNSEFKNKVVSDDLRYIDWQTGPEFPKTFTIKDYNKILNIENKFFARKFNENIDNEIINRLQHYSAS